MLALACSLVASLLLTGALLPLLRRAEVWDVPNQRSSHTIPTPRGGGVAVMAGVLVGCAVGGVSSVWPLAGAAVVLAGVGLADDLWSLPNSVRLLAQLLVAAGVVVWIVQDLGSPVWAPAFVVLGTLGFAAYVNAFNFMDGINGISALSAAVAGGWYAALGERSGHEDLLVLGLATLGGALGFLPWNLARRVFLGDVGSYGLGALLGGMAVLTWAYGWSPVVAVAPLLVYLADTGWALIRRLRGGHRLGEAHRDHVYQRLVDRAGWSHAVAATWCAGAAALACGLLALLTHYVGVAAGTVAAAAVVALYLASPALVVRERA